MLYVYEVLCIDQSTIKDRYIGYSSLPEKQFISCQNGIYIDKVTGKEKQSTQKPSPLQNFVMSHGGWDNWIFLPFDEKYETPHDAEAEKERLLASFPDLYTINVYKTGRTRALLQGYLN